MITKQSCFDAAKAGVHFSNANDIHGFGFPEPGKEIPSASGAGQKESHALEVFYNSDKCYSPCSL